MSQIEQEFDDYCKKNIFLDYPDRVEQEFVSQLDAPDIIVRSIANAKKFRSITTNPLIRFISVYLMFGLLNYILIEIFHEVNYWIINVNQDRQIFLESILLWPKIFFPIGESIIEIRTVIGVYFLILFIPFAFLEWEQIIFRALKSKTQRPSDSQFLIIYFRLWGAYLLAGIVTILIQLIYLLSKGYFDPQNLLLISLAGPAMWPAFLLESDIIVLISVIPGFFLFIWLIFRKWESKTIIGKMFNSKTDKILKDYSQ